MKYKYLNEWADNRLINLEIKGLQKYQDQYLITFFKSEWQLQISLNQGNAFMFITEKEMLPWEEARNLNLFIQIMNKSIIKSVALSKLDRIYFLEIEKRDIYNETKEYTFICEFGANFENLIICEKINNKLIIIDSLKKFSFADNNQRQIIPKMEWQASQTSFTPQTEKVVFPVDIIDGKIQEGTKSGFDNINDLLEKIYYDVIISKKMDQLKLQ